jgi:hypothetical protein
LTAGNLPSKFEEHDGAGGRARRLPRSRREGEGVKARRAAADDSGAVRKPLIAILASVGVLGALTAAGCAGLRLAGDGKTPKPDAGAAAAPAKQAESAPDTFGPDGLREAALSLVPPVAAELPTEEDLDEKDCTAGVDERPPPCISFFFPTRGVTRAERERAVKETARQNGWETWRRKGLSEGFMWFRRGPYRARSLSRKAW